MARSLSKVVESVLLEAGSVEVRFVALFWKQYKKGNGSEGLAYNGGSGLSVGGASVTISMSFFLTLDGY